MRMIKYKFIRNVSRKECSWLDKDFQKGDEIFKYSGYTYGCISLSGIACCEEKGKEPFFEIPTNALNLLKNN